jgi:hypothetical protein
MSHFRGYMAPLESTQTVPKARMYPAATDRALALLDVWVAVNVCEAMERTLTGDRGSMGELAFDPHPPGQPDGCSHVKGDLHVPTSIGGSRLP